VTLNEHLGKTLIVWRSIALVGTDKNIYSQKKQLCTVAVCIHYNSRLKKGIDLATTELTLVKMQSHLFTKLQLRLSLKQPNQSIFLYITQTKKIWTIFNFGVIPPETTQFLAKINSWSQFFFSVKYSSIGSIRVHNPEYQPPVTLIS
jgi:hypothetical protein